jgi:outer membrane protein assembly factor BamB
MPENAGILKKQLVCYPSSDILHPVWTSGKESRFGRGLGPYIMSGQKLYLLDDDGKLYLFKIGKNSATLVSSKVILNGTEAWGPMAIAGKYLIMRDSRNLVCLDIGAKTE